MQEREALPAAANSTLMHAHHDTLHPNLQAAHHDQPAQAVAEMLEQQPSEARSCLGSAGTQTVVAFHGYRDSLRGNGDSASADTLHHRTSASAGFSFSFNDSRMGASSAPTSASAAQAGMSRMTRMRTLRHILKGPTIKLLCALASMSHVSAPYNASIQQRAAAMLRTWAVHAPDVATELVASRYLTCR